MEKKQKTAMKRLKFRDCHCSRQYLSGCNYNAIALGGDYPGGLSGCNCPRWELYGG